MSVDDKPLFSFPRWTPSWQLPEFAPLVAFCACAGLAFAFVHIADEMAEGETRAFDDAVLLALRAPGDLKRPIGPQWLEAAMIDVTSLGGVTVLTLIAALVVSYLLVTARYANAALVLASVAGGAVLTGLLKNAFARPRPELVDHLVTVHSLSFPSGHAMASAVTYLTLGALLARTERRRTVRGFIFAVAGFLTLLIGVSRVFLGVHYPTDVLAGWSLGAAWALACWIVARWLRPKDNETERGS
ncbi:phosphatase PAP2 family protein [Hansschlegelia sp. KR7-227]|uniref:phosphatase PAP2 family protein n=1 Tax=Hansschlegelia sp. KR7-227 TaxID=3400914 RepID=UPI003C0F7A27